MFIHYYGGGIGHRDSAVATELKFNLAEVIYENPDAHFGIENTDEESDDDDKADGLERAWMRKW